MESEDYFNLFSTGIWQQDVLLYSLIGALMWANYKLINYNSSRPGAAVAGVMTVKSDVNTPARPGRF